MAAGDLGRLSRCRPARPQDPHRRQAARDPVVDFRAGAGGSRRTQGRHLARSVRSRHGAHRRADESPFDFVVVDEAQDVGVAELRFLAALGANRPDGLFFTGDLGQRIFQQPFSWRSLGVDVRGRSYTLRINYRTSHQIRAQADRLLPPALSDVDGVSEDRRGTVSVFNGPAPTIETFDDPEQEAERSAHGSRAWSRMGFSPMRSASSSARRASFAGPGLP